MNKKVYYSPRQGLRQLLSRYPDLKDEHIRVTARSLKSEEAIGHPQRRDFPLLTGKEVLMQAESGTSCGQAFTSCPRSFVGSVAEIAELDDGHPGNEALVVAALNAILRRLNLIENTIHCRDQEPEECGEILCHSIEAKHGRCRVGIIGYQPAILEHCADFFGQNQVHITDLNPDNIGQIRFGVEVWDGTTDTERLVANSDVVLITGTVLANETWEDIEKVLGTKPFYFFGTTAAGMAYLNGYSRICPMSE